MSEELKACPFCGIVPAPMGAFAYCRTQGCASQFRKTLIHEWNTRADSPELAQLRAEVENAREVQQQFAAERAKALEELAYEKRRFKRSREAAKDTWATHEKQFADQQEKLDAATARIAELEKERERLISERRGVDSLVDGQKKEIERIINQPMPSCAHCRGAIGVILTSVWEQGETKRRIAELEAEVARLREDGAMLTFLEKLISHCPHAEFYFTDDPDEESPLGFSITIEGCEKTQVSGPTLRDAIRAEMAHSAAIDAAMSAEGK